MAYSSSPLSLGTPSAAAFLFDNLRLRHITLFFLCCSCHERIRNLNMFVALFFFQCTILTYSFPSGRYSDWNTFLPIQIDILRSSRGAVNWSQHKYCTQYACYSLPQYTAFFSLLVLNSVTVNVRTLKYGKQDFRLWHPLKTALPYYDTLAGA